jgi:GT2 family glycosyltransferase
MNRAAIIILNWNGGEPFLACIRSVLELEQADIVIVDNGSTDGSTDALVQLLHEAGQHCQVLDGSEVQALAGSPARTSLVLSGSNLGFAKGINLVLRPLLERPDIEFIWLLNNDAIAEPECLDALRAQMDADPKLGFAGSLILDGTNPQEIQCFGVDYYRWLAVGKMLFKGAPLTALTGEAQRRARPAFQHGASLLVRTACIRQIGLLDDRFFLYSEEHDWQTRGLRSGWGHCRVATSVVRHLGSMSTAAHKYLFFYYYSFSAIRYSRKHQPLIVNLSATIMLFLITMVRTKLRVKSLRYALRGMREAWTTPLTSAADA